MPWDTATKKVPDFKQAIHWLEFGAEHGNADSCLMLGVMLCNGEGCKKDMARGITYLEAAVENGNPKAKTILAIYKPKDSDFISDEEYEALLKEFEQSLYGDREKQPGLYTKLKIATEKQHARLGYLLMKYQWLIGGLPYPFEKRDNGIPYFPVAPRRGSWETFIRIDMDAFPSKDVLLAFSSDIRPSEYDADNYLCPECEINGLKYAGEAVYTSPKFGWLGVEKHAWLFRIEREKLIAPENLQNIIDRFHLQPPEYEGNIAFMVEHGEKEYSVEIAAIYDDQIDVLYRYTIGGSDKVREYAIPVLKEIHLL